jgi:hypothetical protein
VRILRVLHVFTLLLLAAPAFANQAASGFCETGGSPVSLSGLTSATLVQQSFPTCTVTVRLVSNGAIATIYADNANTPLANPFTASAQGYWTFYAANSRYSVSLTNAGISGTIFIPDILLNDPSGGGGTVTSVFGRNGTVVAISGDYTVGQVTGAAPLASPNFTGVPTAPTNSTPSDASTQIATDAFVQSASCTNCLSGNGTNLQLGIWTGSETMTGDVGLTSSPGTAGSNTNPVTLALGNSSTGSTGITGQLEFCAYGVGICSFIVPPATGYAGSVYLPNNAGAGGTFAITASTPIVLNSVSGNITCPSCLTVSNSVSSVFGRTGAVVAANGDYSVFQVTGAAPLASPAFTGTPTAPTSSLGDNSSRLATTAYVQGQGFLTTALVGAGTINHLVMYASTGSTTSNASFLVPRVVGTPIDLLAQSASLGSTALVATTTSADRYIINYYIDQSAVCSSADGTVLATFSWTDASNARQQASATLTFASTLGTSGFLQGTIQIWAATASAINAATTYVACGTGTATYDIHAYVTEAQ